ncbi:MULTISPECIES: hypothetical protein [Hydrocarboniphaga]|jgi:hypothetical protein|uniref:Lipoprotein n=1 Tax=Hydrocarboniphaga effusa AP103 TaxID=1172194 RepID=I8T5P2_9GAMM|nr:MULTISPECIES: hypothetical protein [Hydrocarboniphaga]EIT69255.1 hypothetical protein WQQ_28370 [Hydrocarboniphaga effusa AP103]MDZ4080752.1 hypothetical protein [Hydrocarboniphaga sp.]
MDPAIRFAAVGVCLTSLSLAACTSRPRNEAVAKADRPPACKLTRNVQAAGPQSAGHPPRCADSLDAGKLPASAIAPIMLP